MVTMAAISSMVKYSLLRLNISQRPACSKVLLNHQ